MNWINGKPHKTEHYLKINVPVEGCQWDIPCALGLFLFFVFSSSQRSRHLCNLGCMV